MPIAGRPGIPGKWRRTAGRPPTLPPGAAGAAAGPLAALRPSRELTVVADPYATRPPTEATAAW
eukprot:gene19247-55498_t